MTLKRIALTTLFIGVFIYFLGLVAPFIYFNFLKQSDGAVGIIGATEGLPYMFALRAVYGGLSLVLVLIGVAIIVPAAFCLIFSKTVKTHLRLSTSAVSLGLSAVGALGILCAFVWLITVAFEGPSTHPVDYGVSILFGILSFFAFIILIGLYIKLRKANKSVKGIIIDVLTSIVYLPFFFYIFVCFYDKIS